MTSTLKLLAACSSVSIAMLCSAPAFAGGTAPGTDILNTVNVNYQTGGVAQTTISASDTFKVDRKIIFSLIEAATTGTTTVNPGQAGQVTRFQLTNTSNDTLDFNLSAIQQATSTNAAHGGQDAFDLTSFSFFVDANGNGTYEPATDTATTVDNLGLDESRFIFVVGDVPLSATNGQIAGVQLTATALESDGSAIVAVTDSTANGAMTVETIFADTAKSGVAGTSSARDGIDVATDSYTVSAAVLSVFKSSRIISDGVSTSNFKSIPGAVVEYCISVANAAGGATATNISISDLVPTNTTYVAASIRINGTVTSPGASQSCSGGTAATDSSGDADGGSFGSPANTVAGSLTNISGGTSSALIFQATIN
ncbi:hypothetical protein [Sphingorhabdus sp.]|uniref:hypothetical protein n=1 Tax=Sphingorhabdus sp. TaxID=1902408 RepID=UPI00391D8506